MERISYRIHKNIDFLVYKEGENPIKSIFCERNGHHASVWRNGRYGSACMETEGDEPYRFDILIDKAFQNLDVGNNRKKAYMVPVKNQIPFIGLDYKVQSYKEEVEEAYHEIITAIRCEVYLEIRGTIVQKKIWFGESENLFTDYTGVFLSFTLQDKENRLLTVSETMKLNQISNLKNRVHKAEQELIKKREMGVGLIEKGTRECILHPEVSAMLVHESLGHALEADIAEGSFGIGIREQNICDENINIIDFAHHAFGKKAPVAMFVDDEGSTCRDVHLIKNGKIGDYSYMNNREFAEKYFHNNCTGNARAHYYKDIPMIRMRNTALLPGSMDVSEMFSSIEDGYYLRKVENGQADTGGRYTFRLISGYRIKNGRLLYPVGGNTVIGNITGFLKGITALSSQFEWLDDRICSKKQLVPVAMGGPYVYCSMYIL